MQDFITLTCPNCGGSLEITEDIERFSCAHCGVEHIVKRGGGIVALKPVLDNISKEVGGAARGAESTASELALVRLAKEIPIIQDRLAVVQERVADINNQKSIRSSGMIIGGVGIFIIILGVLLPIIFDEIGGGGFIAVGIGVLILGFVMRFGFTENIEPWKEKEKKLLEQLAELNKKRQYHRDRVDRES